MHGVRCIYSGHSAQSSSHQQQQQQQQRRQRSSAVLPGATSAVNVEPSQQFFLQQLQARGAR